MGGIVIIIKKNNNRQFGRHVMELTKKNKKKTIKDNTNTNEKFVYFAVAKEWKKVSSDIFF